MLDILTYIGSGAVVLQLPMLTTNSYLEEKMIVDPIYIVYLG